MYLEMVGEAKDFTYLVGAGFNDDFIEYYSENYTRDELIDIKVVIRTFFQWLKDNGLFEVYAQNYTIQGEE